jgi:hypothetical protein
MLVAWDTKNDMDQSKKVIGKVILRSISISELLL